MRKKIFNMCIFIILLILIFPNIVSAKYGDLNYRISNVYINDTKKTITFEGWAYIHRTNNYVKSDSFGDSYGGQKVIMQAYDSYGNVLATEVFTSLDEKNEDFKFKDLTDYNLYCDLYWLSGGSCVKDYYKKSMNLCHNTDGYNGSGSQCLYEDISFSITFDVSSWSNGDVIFKIGASNYDFEDKIEFYYKLYDSAFNYDDDIYTNLEDVYISRDAYSGSFDKDFITIQENSFSNTVKFIAKQGTLHIWSNYVNDWIWYPNKWGGYHDGENFVGCDSDIYELSLDNGCVVGAATQPYDKDTGKTIHGRRFDKYKLKTKNGPGAYYCPGDETTVLAYGSHVKVHGYNSFKITTKIDKNTCDVVTNNDELSCNDSLTLNSNCNALTIETTEGYVDVKIEQTGTVSSVLTPDTLYAGGGISFGIMYTNTIKWSYVNDKPNDKLHNEVVKEMNKKIKDYNSYTESINISELKLGDKDFNLIKQCTTSNNKKDYYDKDLIVSCIFTFPKSTIDLNGNVSYDYDVSSISMNNKFYTPINYNGLYNITAKIVGMDRVTDKASKEDSSENTAWTGDWSKTLKNCQINLYSLFYEYESNGNKNKNLNYNFIYRPIDLSNPFPNRNAGINWFDWFSVNNNKNRLVNTYSDSDNLQYILLLDNNAITDIKKYNSNNNYLNWDSINVNTGESSFITEKNYINRVGGNQ